MNRLALAIAVKGEWDPDEVIQALQEAGADASTEIHVACDPTHAPPVAPDGLSIHSKASVSLFELWGLAISRSCADWIAILHADALPLPGWGAAIERAIEESGAGDGYWGPVEPGFGASDPRMVGYLTEYCQFHRPIDPDLKEVPGSNLVLHRKRIEARADFSKTRLLGEGLAPRLVEHAVVRYARPFRFGDYCGRRFRHGRAYAAARTPRLSLFAALPLSAALPFVRTARVIRHGWRSETLRLASLCWLPAIFLAETFWSAGELTGYLTRNPGETADLD